MDRRELKLENLPRPPLFTLVDDEGREVFQETEVSGEPGRKVGVLFPDRELAAEFSGGAEELGMEDFAGTSVRELAGWEEIEIYAAGGADYVVFISAGGSGIFHASDVAQHAAGRAGEMPLPLYVLSDERGEAPLITVESGGEEITVAALFSSPEKAKAFREQAAHLGLPEGLGEISDEDGIRRHALVARQAGAEYAVLDPEAGLAEAIPIEDLIR